MLKSPSFSTDTLPLRFSLGETDLIYMTSPTNKWANMGQFGDAKRRKSVRLLMVADDHSAEGNEDYFAELRECAELCRHLFDVTCNFTSSGEKAIELMRSWEPNAVLVDAHLRDFNSLEIVKQGQTEHVPVIVTSDFPSRDIESSAMEQGAAAYLTKTENPEELELILQEIVNIAAEAKIRH